jgi:hypothetical protein
LRQNQDVSSDQREQIIAPSALVIRWQRRQRVAMVDAASIARPYLQERQMPARPMSAPLLALLLLAAAQAAPAAAQGDKSVQMVIGFGPGGGYDLWGRTVARHIGRHLPGNPHVLPQNMPASTRCGCHGSARRPRRLTSASPIAARR